MLHKGVNKLKRCEMDDCNNRATHIVCLNQQWLCCTQCMLDWLDSGPTPVIDLEAWEAKQRQTAETA